MTEPLLLARARSALRDLIRLAEERAQAEEAVAAAFADATATARREHDETTQQTTAHYETDRTQAEQSYQKARQEVPVAAQAEYDTTEKEFFEARRKVSAEYSRARDTAREEYQEARWTVRTVYEAGKKEAKTQVQRLQEAQAEVTRAKKRLARCQRTALEHIDDCRQGPVVEQAGQPPPGPPRSDDPFADLTACVAAAKNARDEVRSLGLPIWFKGIRLFWLFLLLGVLAGVPAALLGGEQPLPTVAIAVGSALGVATLISLILYFVARAQVRAAYGPLCQALSDGTAARQRCRTWVRENQARVLALMGTLKQRRNQDLQEVQRRRSTGWASSTAIGRGRRGGWRNTFRRSWLPSAAVAMPPCAPPRHSFSKPSPTPRPPIAWPWTWPNPASPT